MKMGKVLRVKGLSNYPLVGNTIELLPLEEEIIKIKSNRDYLRIKEILEEKGVPSIYFSIIERRAYSLGEERLKEIREQLEFLNKEQIQRLLIKVEKEFNMRN